jgi:hypothetical protein
MTMGIARWLDVLGHAMLGAGLALILLRIAEPVGSPLAEGLSLAILASGSWITLAARAIRREPMPTVLAGLPLIPIALGAFPRTPESVRLALVFAVAWSVWLAMQGGSRRAALAHAGAAALLAMGGFLALMGVCESLFQRDEMRRLLNESMTTVPWEDARARAFLLSNRAATTFINANAFAGFLLLLLPAALLTARSKSFRCVLSLILLAGFLASGSLGAALSLIVTFALWAPTLSLRRWSRIALGAPLVAVGLLLALGTESAFLQSKLSSLVHRLDYWKQAVRIAFDTPPWGHGFGAFAELRFGVMRSGEEGSVWVHNTPLQLLIELGPLMTGLFITVLALRWTRGSQASVAAASEPEELQTQQPSRAFLVGVVAATFGIPFISRGTTLLPLHMEWPLVDAMLNTTVVSLLLMLLSAKRSTAGRITLLERAAEPRLLRLGLVAFALHSLIDFDVYSPGNAIAAAALLGIAGPSVKQTLNRSALALIVIVMLFPLLAMQASRQRDEVAHVLARGTRAFSDQEDASIRLGPLDGPAFPGQALAALLHHEDPALNREILNRFASLPPALARRPLHQLWSAQARVASLKDPIELRAILREFDGQSSSRLWPEYLLLSAEIFDRLGQPTDAEATRAEALRLRRP